LTTCIEFTGGGESLVRESKLECRDKKMPSEQDIYEEHVLDHYEDPYHRGPFDEATHAHEADNPLCGDEIHIDLKLNSDGKVAEAWFDGEGFGISQASASMVS